MDQYLAIIYMINCLVIVSICLTELKRIKLTHYSVYGICLITYPSGLLEIIDLVGLKLPELTLMGVLWFPIFLLGVNLILSPGPFKFRPTVLLLMVPTFSALIGGIFLNQTTRYPLLFILLTLPFLRTYEPAKLLVNIRDVIFLSLSLRLIIHFFSILMQSQPQVGSCRADKCNFFGSVITPLGEQSNFMSMTFALMAPLLLSYLSGKKFALASIAVLVNVDLTGGRTGLFAAVLVVFTVLLIKLNQTRSTRGIYSMILAFGLLISSIPVVLSFPNDAFTGRGFIWQLAKNEAVKNPILGAGPSFWVRLAENTSTVSFYSAHNIWLEIAASTGIVAAFCFFLGLSSLLYKVSAVNRSIVTPIVISLLICGTFEVPVLPYRLIQNPGFYLFLLYITSLNINLSESRELRNGKI